MWNKIISNWKTTSAGILMGGGAIIHLVSTIMRGEANENTWTITLAAVVGGVGLFFAGDASASKPKNPAEDAPDPPKTP